MINKEEIICLLKEAAFDSNEYWVTSGAAMVLYGIKAMTRDIDLGCTSQMADKLENRGYYTEVLRDGSRRIVFSETIEIFENWIEDKVVLLEGLPVVSIDGMIKMKEKLGREKDLEGIRLIKEFRNSNRQPPFMKQEHLTDIIRDQTRRALWEVKNVIDCVPDVLWKKAYCEMPCWKHIYHMLHSLDQWYINPRDPDFQEPLIHEPDLNNLDAVSTKMLSRQEILSYFTSISEKLQRYLSELTDDRLLEYPPFCEYSRFTLILAQFRHLHSHMGMLMGFIIDDTGLWPRVLGLECPLPEGAYNRYF